MPKLQKFGFIKRDDKGGITNAQICKANVSSVSPRGIVGIVRFCVDVEELCMVIRVCK